MKRPVSDRFLPAQLICIFKVCNFSRQGQILRGVLLAVIIFKKPPAHFSADSKRAAKKDFWVFFACKWHTLLRDFYSVFIIRHEKALAVRRQTRSTSPNKDLQLLFIVLQRRPWTFKERGKVGRGSYRVTNLLQSMSCLLFPAILNFQLFCWLAGCSF